MAEYLNKLRPDRDLQCYFERPSSVAALSGTSASGFTVSGCWRQQFDWAVVEWSRDNVFEHPALRNLPDGDLSGLTLSYEETRTNCIPLDSTLYPTVDWPYLRIWADDESYSETLYRVRLKDYATAVEGSYSGATVTFTLQGSVTAGDYIELAWLSEHYNYQVVSGNTLADAAEGLAAIINANSSVQAVATGASITLTYPSSSGANGNRVGVYGTVYGSGTASWEPWYGTFSGGVSPTRWRIELNFGKLQDINGETVPTTRVRRMRWTWAAERQSGTFQRCEFAVVVANWVVTGTGRGYQVAGEGSRRIEDDSAVPIYTGPWTEGRGNFSGGSIRFTTTAGAAVACTYAVCRAHRLYLGTRRAALCGSFTVTIDGGAAKTYNLALAGEDVLVRHYLGDLSGGVAHTVTITHTGTPGSYLYFDYLEAAVPTNELPVLSTTPRTTLATDWDTDHSIALAPERTAWLIDRLGFRGRANHYVGALWFYELERTGHAYASATIAFSGVPEFSRTTTVNINGTAFEHLNLIGDTAVTIAKAFELMINEGSTGVWAAAADGVLTITARSMGTAGNAVTLAASSSGGGLVMDVSGSTLTGGVDGIWQTDLTAIPRINRAARDWSRSYYTALKSAGVEVAAAFSMELQHGDASAETGIAQRYPGGDAVWLNTPALQTNFSPASTAFWKQVYLDMASVMAEAGQTPFLQFGEVQWWYFPDSTGMPFYDAYTTTRFQELYSRSLPVFTSPSINPADYPDECNYLSGLIADFTDSVIAFVRQAYPAAKFEVLYPPDVNEPALSTAVNLPSLRWTTANLACFKTENFTFTGNRDLDKARKSIALPMQLGFPRQNSGHLVGISEYTTPWLKEHNLSVAEGLESVVLFALDQFCLIGYPVPADTTERRSCLLGA